MIVRSVSHNIQFLVFKGHMVFFIVPEESEHEDDVEHEFKSEKFESMGVPFVIDDHLDRFV